MATVLSATALLAGCRDEPGIPPRPTGDPPRRVDTAAIAEGDLVAAVLEECHGPLRGRMDRISVTVDLPDGKRLQAHASLPGSLRIVDAGEQFVLRDGAAWKLGEEPRAATPAEAERLADLLELVDRAALGPLYRAESCTRTAADAFALAQEGPPMTLRLRPGTLLPAAVGDVGIDEHLRTPVAWISRHVTHPRLGACELLFEDSGIRWEPGFFAPPGQNEPARGGASVIRMPSEPIGSRSATPAIEKARAANWLVLDDPGDWSARARIYTPLHELLVGQDQQIAGFPILTRLDGRDVLAIPFRTRDGGTAPALPPGSEVLELPAGRELVVYPKEGGLEARRAVGTARLRAELDDKGLEADGPVRCQPYVHLHEGPPTAAKLADLKVRMSVRVR